MTLRKAEALAGGEVSSPEAVGAGDERLVESAVATLSTKAEVAETCAATRATTTSTGSGPMIDKTGVVTAKGFETTSTAGFKGTISIVGLEGALDRVAEEATDAVVA